jgi:hypothetical protein
MKKRTTENIQPEPVLNSEKQTNDTASRQTIANTHVGRRQLVLYKLLQSKTIRNPNSI